jgi:hypothetical protein
MATMETIEGKGESSEKPLPPISALDKIIVALRREFFCHRSYSETGYFWVSG